MIDASTGQTVYEIVQSFDTNNNPVSAATFDLNFYVNGQISNTIIPDINLIIIQFFYNSSIFNNRAIYF